MTYVPLFPYPFCALCFDRLHEGHHGWDICHECAMYDAAPLDISCDCYRAMSGPIGPFTSRPREIPMIDALRCERCGRPEDPNLVLVIGVKGNAWTHRHWGGSQPGHVPLCTECVFTLETIAGDAVAGELRKARQKGTSNG